MGRPKKYSRKVAGTIIDLLSKDTYTVAEVCKIAKIAPSTYYSWRSLYLEFSQGLKEAEETRTEIIKVEAEKSLIKLIKGYDVTETQVNTIGTGKFDVNGREIVKVKSQRTTTKHIQPDTQAVIFALCNSNPTKWKNYRTNELTGKDNRPLFSNYSDNELDIKIAELERKNKP